MGRKIVKPGRERPDTITIGWDEEGHRKVTRGRHQDPPDIDIPKPGPTRRTSRNKQSRELTVNATSGTLPLVYGRTRIGGQLMFQPVISSGTMILAFGACLGEIDSFEKIEVNGKNITTYGGGITYTVHTGTLSQTVDTRLQSARSSQGDSTYATGHPGIAYVSMTIGQTAGIDGIPDVRFVIKGKKCLDPRSGATAYTENPFVILRDILTNDWYGLKIPTTKFNDAVGSPFRSAADYADANVGLSAPSGSPTLVDGGANGSQDAGTKYYLFTDVDGLGNETIESTVSNITLGAGGHSVDITSPAFATGVVKRRYYRADAATPISGFRRVGEATTNGTFNDPLADASISANPAPPTSQYSKARYKLGIVFDTTHDGEEWVQTMRAHAPCWIPFNGKQYDIVADQPKPQGYTHPHEFTAADIIGTIKVARTGVQDSPNSIVVKHTDATNADFPDASVKREIAAVATGAEERREAQYDLPGCPDGDQAQRFALYYLNRRLADTTVAFDCFQVGLKILPGDVIKVTHPIGFSNTEFRVISAVLADDGNSWRVNALEYTELVFSNVVVLVDPGIQTTENDPTIPPPDPTGVTLTEVVTTGPNGLASTRIKILWTPAETVIARDTHITYNDGVNTVEYGFWSQGPVYINSPTLNQLYTVTLKTRNISSKVESTGVVVTITPVGTTPTGTVASLALDSVIGNVAYQKNRADWTPLRQHYDVFVAVSFNAITNDPNIRRYVVRVYPYTGSGTLPSAAAWADGSNYQNYVDLDVIINGKKRTAYQDVWTHFNVTDVYSADQGATDFVSRDYTNHGYRIMVRAEGWNGQLGPIAVIYSDTYGPVSTTGTGSPLARGAGTDNPLDWMGW